MGRSAGGSGGCTRRHGVAANAAPVMALLCALLGHAGPALALTPSSATVIPAIGAAGQGTAITALVSGGGEKPGGTVTVSFGDGATSPPVTLADGTATVIHIYAGPGSYGVTVSYSGDDTFAPSTGIGTATVNLYP
ncbi:MAG TPA: Ig-like domain-containing protein [Xanthobacteraceae bacterium]|nr:Ig-like domain-containing protein [Xanthobacteraceae bacterium]